MLRILCHCIINSPFHFIWLSYLVFPFLIFMWSESQFKLNTNPNLFLSGTERYTFQYFLEVFQFICNSRKMWCQEKKTREKKAPVRGLGLGLRSEFSFPLGSFPRTEKFNIQKKFYITLFLMSSRNFQIVVPL